MNKKELVEILRTSLPSRRMLEVVNIGAVKVGNELIVLKQRPNYDLIEENLIPYNYRQNMHYHYKELIAKDVVFDIALLNMRGRKAIEKYIGEGNKNES